MSDRRELLTAAGGRRAQLMRKHPVRVLDIGRGGCLVVSSLPLRVGATGELRFALQPDGKDEHAGSARIRRTVLIAGAGPEFRSGVEFEWSAPRTSDSLKSAALKVEENSAASSNRF